MRTTALFCGFLLLPNAAVSPQPRQMATVTNEKWAGKIVKAYPSAEKRLVEEFGKLPLNFEINQSQSDKQVKYTARGPG